MAEVSRNDGELRTAFFGMAVAASDAGHLDKAVQAMDKEYAVAEKKNDVVAMAADLQAKGNIIAEMSKYDLAAQQFDRSFQMIKSATLPRKSKTTPNCFIITTSAALAIAKKDYPSAKSHAANIVRERRLRKIPRK